MLAQTPVADLTLNELSRRVGLAKSNVLRYFDSREAILLDVLDAEMSAWVGEVERALSELPPECLRQRTRIVTDTLATTLAARPVLCDLLHAESGVLERNVSVEAVLRHKHSTQVMADDLTRIIRALVPELTPEGATEVIITLLLVAAAAWPYAQPSEALSQAYRQDERVAAMHRDFAPLVGRILHLTVAGLLSSSGP